MSLGFARDSIGDLQSLMSNNAAAQQENTNCERLLLPSKLQSPTFVDTTGEDNFLLLSEESEEKVEEFHLPSQPANNTAITSPKRVDVEKASNDEELQNQQTLKKEKTQQEPQIISMYSGFSSSTYDDYDYYQDPYAPSSYNPESDNELFCCLFPWIADKNNDDDDSDSSTCTSSSENEAEETNDKTEVEGDNKTSTATTGFKKEKKSEHIESTIQKDASINKESTSNKISPDTTNEGTTSPSSKAPNVKQEGPRRVEFDLGDGKKLLGILKHTKSNFHADKAPGNQGLSLSNSVDNGEGGKPRRNLFPTYDAPSLTDDKDTIKDSLKPSKSVQFSPMARVMPITPRNMMSFMMKSSIWWQRSDYEEFKRAGRIISKAMLQGGSEIWLQTSNAWGDKKSSSNRETSEEKDGDSVGDKWWCKFGHSRRGLEHIVTIEEGRSRQQYVNNAIRAVLEEQRRQRITCRDPERLASVAARHTAWARDLALAAGAADEEAVQSNFCTNARSRVQHLSRNLSAKGSQNDGHLSANFIISANHLTHEMLDANTETSFRLRRQDKLRIKKTLHEYNQRKEPDMSKAAAGFLPTREP